MKLKTTKHDEKSCTMRALGTMRPLAKLLALRNLKPNKTKEAIMQNNRHYLITGAINLHHKIEDFIRNELTPAILSANVEKC